MTTFSVAGIETWWFLPPAVAFLISFCTSMGGVSGAFLILPFQISVLGFAGPAATSTNFLYNMVGTPGGILRYFGEQRMVWSLAGTIVGGALPGVLVGYYLRVKFLPDPARFKLFVGVVLLLIALRLARSIFDGRNDPATRRDRDYSVAAVASGWRRLGFRFHGETFAFSTPVLWGFSLAVGIVGGVYGIGGGALLAPFCITVLGLPVFAVAGAVLLANLVNSSAGILFYTTDPFATGTSAAPDWLLGLMLGLGGLLGMYLGARTQRHVPERWIKLILFGVVITVAGKYIYQFGAGGN